VVQPTNLPPLLRATLRLCVASSASCCVLCPYGTLLVGMTHHQRRIATRVFLRPACALVLPAKGRRTVYYWFAHRRMCLPVTGSTACSNIASSPACRYPRVSGVTLMTSARVILVASGRPDFTFAHSLPRTAAWDTWMPACAGSERATPPQTRYALRRYHSSHSSATSLPRAAPPTRVICVSRLPRTPLVPSRATCYYTAFQDRRSLQRTPVVACYNHGDSPFLPSRARAQSGPGWPSLHRHRHAHLARTGHASMVCCVTFVPSAVTACTARIIRCGLRSYRLHRPIPPTTPGAWHRAFTAARMLHGAMAWYYRFARATDRLRPARLHAKAGLLDGRL